MRRYSYANFGTFLWAPSILHTGGSNDRLLAFFTVIANILDAFGYNFGK